MANHMRQSDAGPAAGTRPASHFGSDVPSEPAPRFTPGPASNVQGDGPRRFTTTGHRPKSWWGTLVFVLFIAAVGVGFTLLFILPNLHIGLGGAGPLTGEQTATVTSQDGTSWDLVSDLRSPVELQGVTDDGVALRFLPVESLPFVTVHVVSCEVNGVDHDPSKGDAAVSYTVMNESTGETVETIDPYFITSGTGDVSEGTVLVVRAEGLSADQYESLVLGIDQQLAEEDDSTNYSTEDVTGLSVSVTQE